ncbi:MAG: hypothetical protein FJZ57_08145 [Chlamydiae bacterium]|nr:hypothetical protein [Chlamydiota bacterium]
MSYAKKIILAIGAIVLIFGCITVIQKYNGKFSIENLTSSKPFEMSVYSGVLSEEESRAVEAAFSQKYTYLQHGKQVFPFVSEDGKYVIKFVRHYKAKPPFYHSLPLPKSLRNFATKRAELNREKVDVALKSFVIAESQLKKESGLLYVHINKTSHIQKSLQVKDKLYRNFSINLDDYDFIVQKTAVLAYDQIKQLMDNNQIEQAQTLVLQIIDLIETRLKNGIHDNDITVFKNVGVVDGKPIFIDLGRFSYLPANTSTYDLRKDFLKQISSFYDWISKKYPQLEKQLKTRLDQIFYESI